MDHTVFTETISTCWSLYLMWPTQHPSSSLVTVMLPYRVGIATTVSLASELSNVTLTPRCATSDILSHVVSFGATRVIWLIVSEDRPILVRYALTKAIPPPVSVPELAS